MLYILSDQILLDRTEDKYAYLENKTHKPVVTTLNSDLIKAIESGCDANIPHKLWSEEGLFTDEVHVLELACVVNGEKWICSNYIPRAAFKHLVDVSVDRDIYVFDDSGMISKRDWCATDQEVTEFYSRRIKRSYELIDYIQELLYLGCAL